MNTSEEIIKKLGLQAHPEGGYFKETYRSEQEIKQDSLHEQYQGTRNFSTCIYFLLTSENFSAFHRIKQDEIWHFYDGSPILLHMISPQGSYSQIEIGNDLSAGQIPQHVVPGGYWFASEVKQKESHTLVGCTVSPGFSFNDFELKSEVELTSLFPEHKAIISKMTHS